MTSTRNLARIAGLFYLAVAVCGGFAESVRSSVTVAGDEAATYANVVQHASLLHVGFVADVVDLPLFIGVGLILYVILRPTGPGVALGMLVMNAVSVAIQGLNMLNQLAAMLVAAQPTYIAGLGPGEAHGAVLFFLDMHQQGYLIAQIFFGLYLLPLAYLVARSGLFPKVLGAVLAVGCAGYVGGVAADYLSPTFVSAAGTYFGLVGGLAETVFLGWLLIRGVKVPERDSQLSGSIEGALA
jgi:hypothetical protein